MNGATVFIWLVVAAVLVGIAVWLAGVERAERLALRDRAAAHDARRLELARRPIRPVKFCRVHEPVTAHRPQVFVYDQAVEP